MLNKLNDNDFPDIRTLYKTRIKHKKIFSLSNLKMKVLKNENSHKRLNSDNNLVNDNNNIFFPLKKIKNKKIPLLLSPFSKNNSNKFLSDINLEYNNTERSEKIYKKSIDIFFEKLIDRKKQNSSNKYLNYTNNNFSSFLSTNNNNNKNNSPYKINFNEYTINNSNKEIISSFNNNNNNIKTEQNLLPKIKNYNFNNVLMKLFRIVSIYNSKNSHLNDIECVNMMNKEIEKFYKDSNNEKMDDYRKNYMRKFTNEIKYLFSNTEISKKINNIEHYNNTHKDKLYLENIIFNKTELTNIFGENYSNNLIRLKNKLFTEKVYQKYNINERFRNINKLFTERLKDHINLEKILFNNEITNNLMKSNSNYKTLNTENLIYKYRNSFNSPINFKERSFIANNYTEKNLDIVNKINEDKNDNNDEIFHILNLKENNLNNVLNTTKFKKNKSREKLNLKNNKNEKIILFKDENNKNNNDIKNIKNKLYNFEFNNYKKNSKNLNEIEKIDIQNGKLNENNEKINEKFEKLNENNEELNENYEKYNENIETINENKEKLNENNEKYNQNNEILNDEKIYKINNKDKSIKNLKNKNNKNLKKLKTKNIIKENINNQNNNNNKDLKEGKNKNYKIKNKKTKKIILNEEKTNNQNNNNDLINNTQDNNISNNKGLSSTGSWEEISSSENEENKNKNLHHHKHKNKKHHHHKNHNNNENNNESFSSKNSEYFEEEEKNENNFENKNSDSNNEIDTNNINNNNNNIQNENNNENNSINSQIIKEKIKNDKILIIDNNNNNINLKKNKENNISKFRKKNKYYDKSHLKNLFGLIKNAEILKQEKKENLLKKKSIHINQHPKKLESKNSFSQYENISLKIDKKIKKTRSKLFNLNVLDESIEYEKDNIREEYSLLSPNTRKKKTREMKLKLNEDIQFYLNQKNWDEKDRLKLMDMKNKINNLKDFNMDELNLFLDFNDELEDMKIAREMENRINKFCYNLNNNLSLNKNKREILESKIPWKDDIF